MSRVEEGVNRRYILDKAAALFGLGVVGLAFKSFRSGDQRRTIPLEVREILAGMDYDILLPGQTMSLKKPETTSGKVLEVSDYVIINYDGENDDDKEVPQLFRHSTDREITKRKGTFLMPVSSEIRNNVGQLLWLKGLEKPHKIEIAAVVPRKSDIAIAEVYWDPKLWMIFDPPHYPEPED